MEMTAHIVGLAMAAGALIVFLLICPRRGRISPLLVSDFAEQIVMMSLIAVLATGLMLALGGLPPGMPMTR